MMQPKGFIKESLQSCKTPFMDLSKHPDFGTSDLNKTLTPMVLTKIWMNLVYTSLERKEGNFF